MVLAGAGAHKAKSIADRICESLSETSNGSGQRLTVSIGLAVFHEDGRATAELLAAADRALYEAKAAGGDSVFTAGS